MKENTKTDEITVRVESDGRRVFAVDVGDLPEEKAAKFVEEIKAQYLEQEVKGNSNDSALG